MLLKNKTIFIVLLALSTLAILSFGRRIVEASSEPTHNAVETHHGGAEKDAHVEEATGHGEKEVHGEEVHEGAEHHEAEGHGEESWWRFPGWQIVFAAIACLYFALVLAWLPLLVAKEAEGGHH